MKIRFDVEAFQKILESGFRKYSAGFRTAIMRFRILLISLLLIMGLLSIPEIVVKVFQRENIKHQIEEFINQVPLAVSYDGMTFGAYGGVELYNLRVSSESDFSREKVLLQTPVLRLSFNIIDIVFNRKWNINKIEIDGGTVELQSEKNGQNQELLNRFMTLVRKESSPVILFSNSKLIYKNNLSDNDFTWNFRKINGSIRSNAKSILLKLDLFDNNWGKGKVEYHSAQCDNCEAGHGNYKLDFSDLPIVQFNDIFSEYSFERGEVEGRLEMVYLPDKEKIFDVTGGVALNGVKMKRGKDHFIELSLAKLNGSFNIDKSEWHLNFNGTWDKSAIDFEMSKSPKSNWLNTFRLSLEPVADSQLYFPYGYVAGGLNKATIDIQKVKGKLDKFEITEAILKWDNGFIYSLNYKPFQFNIQNADVYLKENEFEAKATVRRNSSNVTFSMNGSIEAYLKNAIISFYRYGRVEKRSVSRTILAFKTHADGAITSENLIWDDLSDYYNTFSQKWEESFITGLAQGWRAPIMHDLEWFHRFIISTNINFTVDLKNVVYGEKSGVHLSGKTFLQNKIFQFDVDDVEDENRMYVRWNATQNYPFLSGEFRLTFPEVSSFSRLWIPNEIFSSYESAIYEYAFSSMGERAVDYVRTHKGEGSFTLSKAVLRPGLPSSSDKDLPRSWDEISGAFRRTGSKAWLYGISAENAMYKSTARGTWIHSLENSTWDFSTQFREKN